MIKSISLRNWKTHLGSRLEFVKGTNVIVGPMGSGKSSVMDAVSFALYGTFPSQAARRVSLEETIMDRPMKQERATVKLEFDYLGKDYAIERIVKRNSMNEAYLREGGRIISGPKPTDVNAKVWEILEVGYDLFSRAVYSEQNQIDYFLRLSPSQRKEKFDELLGLDRYERVRANAGTLFNRLKKNMDDRRAFLEELRKKFDGRQLAEYEKKILEKTKELAAKKTGFDSVGKEIERGEALLKRLDAGEKAHKTLSDSYIKFKSRADALKEHTEKAREKLRGTDVKKLSAQMQGLEKEIAAQEQERGNLKKQLDAVEKNLAELGEHRAVLRSALGQNARTAKGASSLGANCPVCKRPLGAHDRKKLETELEEENVRISKEIEKAEGHIQKALPQAEALRKKIEACGNGREGLAREIEAARRNLDALAELQEKEKALGGAQAETEAYRKELEKFAFDGNALSLQRNAASSLREKAAKLRAEIGADGELLRELEIGLARTREAAAQVQELEAQTARGNVSLEKLSIFISALKATQADLRNTMIETVNEAMDEVWGKVYPYGDLTSVKIAVQEGSYEVMVRQRSGEWARVEGILSGGERSSAALAMRIAVSLVLTQNLGWIILDEPTHNLDANAVRELSEMMRTHLPQLIDQIFIITHDKEMENAASGKLYVLEREKGSDGATRIAGE